MKIHGIHSLTKWVDQRVPITCDHTVVATIVQRIRHCPHRPEWGADWTEFLSQFPEVLTDPTT